MNDMTKKDIAKMCVAKRGKITKYALGKKSGLTIGQIERIEGGKENYTIDLLTRHLPSVGLKLEVK